MKRKYLLIIIILILLLTLVLVPLKSTLAAADPLLAYSITAEISDSSDYINSTIINSNGYASGITDIDILDWEYNKSKYIQIETDWTNFDFFSHNYRLVIELPKELYFVSNDFVIPEGFTNVNFTKNESLLVNTEEYYDLKPLSGTLEYTIDESIEKATVQLEIRYDEVLWDKMTNSNLNSEDVIPINIKVICDGDSTGNTYTDNYVRVLNVFSGSSIETIENIYYQVDLNTEILNSNINALSNQTISMKTDFTSEIIDLEWYYEKLTYDINLPYYTTSDGTKHYLELDTSTLKLLAFTNPDYTIDTSTEGKVSIILNKPYFKAGDFLSANFKSINSELLNLNKPSFTFTGGTIKGYATSNAQVENIEVYSLDMPDITIENTSYENLIFNNVLNKENTITNRPTDAISLLGGFYLQNAGTKETVEKQILQEFDTTNTNSIKVTSVNLPVDRISEQIEVEYSLVDDNGNLIYFDTSGNIVDSSTSGATSTWKITLNNDNYNNSGTNKPVLLERTLLSSLHQQYYFKSIKYNIKTINAGDILYSSTLQNSNTSPGNFYGYIGSNATSGTNAITKMTIGSPNNEIIENLTATSTSSFSTDSTTAIYIDNITMDENVIRAGNSFVLNGSLNVLQYPYGNSTWVNNIILGLILPYNITVNEQSVIAKTANNQNISGITISSKDLSNGNNLWTIKYPADICIGYSTENFESLLSGSSTNFSIQLDTSADMSNTSVFASNVLFATGLNQDNKIAGDYAWAMQTDTYDLNENSKTDDNIARVKTTDNTYCQIVAKSESLEITDNVILNSQGNIGEETDEITLLSKDDILIYNVDIVSSNVGIADEFVGYIPVPKTTLGRDDYLIESNIDDSFNFALQGNIEITGTNIFTVSYSFEQGLTYETASSTTTWYTAEDIENDANLNWSDVTMIKIQANSQIETGNTSRITANFKYLGENYIQEAGLKNIWHSTFAYRYTNGDISIAGHYPTIGVSAQISHTENLPEITLTAAKNMLPKISGNINERTVSITQFKKAQEFSIVNVETYNVNLQNKEYMISNPDLTGNDANSNFAVTIQLTDQTEQSIVSDVLTNPVSIGGVNSNTTLEYTYKIYNANSLSDITQTRYIIVTLKSDNGVILKQQININRELAEAENPQSSIILGENYLPSDETNSNITITQNSTLTTQYVIEHIPNNYNKKKISFSNNLPVNTKMILINATDSENLLYWYYNVSSSINEIDLMDFLEMGKTSENTYAYPTGNDVIKEKYLLILDFSKCTEVIEGETTVKMIYSGENVSDFYSTELKFTQSAKRTFSLETEKSESNFGKDITINYETLAPSASESNYTGKKLSLVINASEELPIDSYIISNETNYFLNTNRQFIIPLNDVTEGSNSITLNLNSKTLPLEATNYECTCELWVSATANGNSPLSGEKLAEQKIVFENEEKPNPSLKVLNMDKRVLMKDDLATQRTVVFDYKSAENCRIEFELQQKDGTSYLKITNKLNKVNETTEHSNGIFAISAIDGNNTITCNLSSETDAGTYRFILRVKDENNNKLLEMPYNFIVLDE